MDVALTTEGTYPHSQGGVSVWCDQIVRGMPDVTFDVIAMTAFGNETPVWELPANVRSVRAVGLWGEDAQPSATIPRSKRPRVREAFHTLLRSGLANASNDTPVVERDAMWATLAELDIATGLPLYLRTVEPVRIVLDVWREAVRKGLVDSSTPLSVGEAVAVVESISHSLRPLAVQNPRVELFHAVSNGLAVLPALAAHMRHGTPFVVSEHGVYLRERLLAKAPTNQSPAARAVLMGFTKELVSVAYRRSAVVAPGNLYNRAWQIRLGARPDHIVTTYNGVDPGAFPDAGDEPSAPTLSFVGRIDPLKDLETLVRAFALVRHTIPEARLRIFGGTPRGNEGYLNRCKDLGESLNLGDSVCWEGRVDNVADGYSAGSIVVLTSISEGFPYSVIEGMCCGRPIVATDVGGVTEAVGEAGLVVPPRDPQAFADACISLLRDDATRRSLGVAARERVLTHFTLDRAVETVHGVYQRAARTVELPQPRATPAMPNLIEEVSR